MNSPQLVIFHEDSLGLTAENDDNIIEAFSRGLITQASLRVDGPTAKRAAAQARRAGVQMGLRLDLAATEIETESHISRFEELVGSKPLHIQSRHQNPVEAISR